ncbi:MAG: NTP transferase domain-containing protein [Candidatus Omnitrophota bacterium]
MEKITAVILAAGLGTRMKSSIPKVLHPFRSGTILGSVICNLKSAGISDIAAVVGYKAEEIESSFKNENIKFVRQKELLGSGDALACAVREMDDEEGMLLVTCGDTPLITDETYGKMVEGYRSGSVSCVLLTCVLPEPGVYGRIKRDEKGNILKIVEEKDASEDEKKITEINAGTYCFRKSDVKKFISDIKLNEKKKEFYLTDIIDILRCNGKKIISCGCGREEAIGINSRRDLAMANKISNRKKLDELMDCGVTIVDPDNTYIDDTVEIGSDTVIFPNTVIEKDVKIASGCSIGPFARLRPGTRLADKVEVGNFVELCRTEIQSGAKVKHHTYLGDTVVGKDVNIGAGTITANYDGKNKHRTEIGDNAFIGVGAVLIAPVKIGKNARVGAGSVVTKNKDVPAGETVVGVPAKRFRGSI